MVSKSSSTSPSKSWRVFCAIEIPTEVRNRVLEHADRVCQAALSVQASWTKMENIHLTLKFFGNVERDKISKISRAADAVARQFSPLKIHVDGTGAFPKHGPARVLWIGLNDSSGKLIDLQKQFDRECAQEGFAAEDRAFHPHLTVARLRSSQGARRLSEVHGKTKFDPVDFTATGLTVFRSELSGKGSLYSVISQHPLSANS
jgi:RNA 2',3'-cyclic 3'-phosphodiesterase